MPARLRPLAAVAMAVLLCSVSAAGRNQDAPASIEFRLAPTGDQEPVFGMAGEHSPARYGRGQLQGTIPQDVPPSRPEHGPKKGRAWIEWGAFVTLVTVQYWASNSFPEDRDFRLTLDDQIRRVVFLDGLRFDSNQFSLNWSHILGGAMYYQFGRTNNLSWSASWLMALAGSTWWEVVGEPKEVISINDQFLTAAGGLPLGEAWFQVGNFLLHRPRGLERALSIANPVLVINHWLDRKDPAGRAYVQPGWHDFSLILGGRRLSAAGARTGTDLYLGVRARLIGLPDYGLPGEVRRPLRDTYIAELDFDYATRNGHAEETRLYAKAVPWGRQVQKIDQAGRGYCLTFGFGSSFEYFKKRPLADYDAVPVPVKTDLARLRLDEPRAFTDKLAIVHLAGPVLDATVFRRGLTFRAGVEASLDFALVNATAINDYSRRHDIAGLKTTVFYYGYYYGVGGSVAARARLEAGPLSVHGLAEYSAWGSTDTLDRFQAEIADNAHLSDGRVRLLAGATLRVPRTPLRLFAELESVRRSGRLKDVRSLVRETKAYAGLAFSF